MKKLISMVDYLPNHPYSKFLKQTLSIEMFVPCKLVDGVWVVLEEPKPCDCMGYTEDCGGCEFTNIEYQEAKDRVLFEGFEKDNSFVTHKSHASFFYPISCLHEQTIEYLVKYNLELTPTALKQIGI